MEIGRRELLRKALEERLHDVWSSSIAGLKPSDFDASRGLVYDFISKLQAQTSEAADGSLGAYLYEQPTEDYEWTGCGLKFTEALIRLSLGNNLELYHSRPSSVEAFLDSYRGARRNPAERFNLLSQRYACPLNITLDSHTVREALLEELMVRDRSHLEKGSFQKESSPGVLLKLNLLAVYAASHASTDLRFLDALNYYYEILHEEGSRALGSHRLYASYLGLYARALSAWLYRKFSE